jgi:mannose-6-phosphate isomerase-like protein (cupin superfamily)
VTIVDYVRPVDFAKFRPTDFHSQFIGDQNSGVDTCNLICTRVPPGTGTPSVHTHTGDQFYFILKGEMNLHLGENHLKAGAGDLVFIPQGVPHRNWNDTNDEEIHFELIAPGIPTGLARSYFVAAPDANTQLKPMESADYVRHIDTSKFNPDAFTSIIMADRSSGSNNCRLNLVRVPPGRGGPALHIHTFDQFYYVIDGEMKLQIGQEKFTAGPNTYVILPHGVPHANWNEGSVPETHIAVLVPEPFPGGRLDIPVYI